MTEACAAIVQRDDPHLYATALFAPEPARSRLMVLYAFDCELSRASRSSRESMIPRMRLQWWRDAIAEADAGEKPKAHEVAAPLNALVQDCDLMAVLTSLVDGHALELDPGRPLNGEKTWNWRDVRYPAFLRAACQVLSDAPADPLSIGNAMADAFALRHALRMAQVGGRALIPDIKGRDLAELSRGALTDSAKTILRTTAMQGLNALENARRTHKAQRQTIPALLPTLWTERTLRLVQRDPSVILGQLDDIDRPFDGLRLAWHALRGRW